MTHDQGRHSFAIVLGEADGEERFRTTVMACDREQAIRKAERLAERLNVDVELVEPAEGLPMVQISLPAEEMAADAAWEQGSDPAE